jgi:hypothetical protein
VKLSLLVVQDRLETWFKGKKDEKEVRTWTVLDAETDPHIESMSETFDYRPSEEEEAAIPLGKARMGQVEIACRKFFAAPSGRICFLGRVMTFNGKALPGSGGNGAVTPGPGK